MSPVNCVAEDLRCSRSVFLMICVAQAQDLCSSEYVWIKSYVARRLCCLGLGSVLLKKCVAYDLCRLGTALLKIYVPQDHCFPGCMPPRLNAYVAQDLRCSRFALLRLRLTIRIA